MAWDPNWRLVSVTARNALARANLSDYYGPVWPDPALIAHKKPFFTPLVRWRNSGDSGYYNVLGCMGDGSYLFLAYQKALYQDFASFSWDGTDFKFVDTGPQIPNNSDYIPNSGDLWCQNGWIVAFLDNTDFRVYSRDGSGELTLHSWAYTYDSGLSFGRRIVGDGTYWFSAHEDGVASWSVDGSGTIAKVDEDNTDSDSLSPQGLFVSADGYLYVGWRYKGISSYSIDGSGHLTHVDRWDDDNGGGPVWGDDSGYLYMARRNGAEVVCLSISAGTLTQESSCTPSMASPYNYQLWGDASYGVLYLATYEGLDALEFDGEGNVQPCRDSYFHPGSLLQVPNICYNVWSDGTYIYLSSDRHLSILELSTQAKSYLTA